MGPRINSAPVSLVGCSDSRGFGFRNLIHHEGEAGPVGAIDDQSLFESRQDNVLHGLALDMPAQYFFQEQSMFLVCLDVNISIGQRLTGDTQVRNQSFAGPIGKSTGRHNRV